MILAIGPCSASKSPPVGFLSSLLAGGSKDVRAFVCAHTWRTCAGRGLVVIRRVSVGLVRFFAWGCGSALARTYSRREWIMTEPMPDEYSAADLAALSPEEFKKLSALRWSTLHDHLAGGSPYNRTGGYGALATDDPDSAA